MKSILSLNISALSLIIILGVSTLSWAGGNKISAREASSYIGQTATVCGYVASTKFAYRSKGQPTFLNLDEPYPRQIFTALIWGNDRPAFGSPENSFSGKNICVTGQIKNYKGTPEIIVRGRAQIMITN